MSRRRTEPGRDVDEPKPELEEEEEEEEEKPPDVTPPRHRLARI